MARKQLRARNRLSRLSRLSRPLGQELATDDVNRFSMEVGAAKKRGLDAWRKFQVFSAVLWRNVAKDIVDPHWVLTWMSVEGRRAIKARLVARGFQDPDLAAWLVGTSSCVSLRSSHLQAISFSALKNGKWAPSCKQAPFHEKFIPMRHRSGVRGIRIVCGH